MSYTIETENGERIVKMDDDYKKDHWKDLGAYGNHRMYWLRGGMWGDCVEMTEEDYALYLPKQQDGTLYTWFKDNRASASLLYGYGFYGIEVVRVDGVPVLCIESGTSCD